MEAESEGKGPSLRREESVNKSEEDEENEETEAVLPKVKEEPDSSDIDSYTEMSETKFMNIKQEVEVEEVDRTFYSLENSNWEEKDLDESSNARKVKTERALPLLDNKRPIRRTDKARRTKSVDERCLLKCSDVKRASSTTDELLSRSVEVVLERQQELDDLNASEQKRARKFPIVQGKNVKTESAMAIFGEMPSTSKAAMEDHDDKPAVRYNVKNSSRVTRSNNPEFSAKQRSFLQKMHAGGICDDSSVASSDASDSPSDSCCGKRKRRKSESASSVDNSSESSRTSDDSGPRKRRSPRIETMMVQPSPFLNGRDKYCWNCHREGAVIPCMACPRVYHQRCTQLSAPPGERWVCPECVIAIRAECVKTQSRAMRLITVEQLSYLLKYALNRMKGYPGSEPFVRPVDQTEFPRYREFVVRPMDLSTMERNIRKKHYGCTESFLADAKWLLHNCIVFNTTQAKLSSLARGILKICRTEMAEIETCPDCYLNSYVAKGKDCFFIDVCKRPHVLVWAKLRGFPYWPAKVMKVDRQVHVRFFGDHRSSSLPFQDVYLFSLEWPKNYPKKIKEDMQYVLEEVERHIKRIRDKYGQFNYAKVRTPFDPAHKPLRFMIPAYQGDYDTDDEDDGEDMSVAEQDDDEASSGLEGDDQLETVEEIEAEPTKIETSLMEWAQFEEKVGQIDLGVELDDGEEKSKDEEEFDEDVEQKLSESIAEKSPENVEEQPSENMVKQSEDFAKEVAESEPEKLPECVPVKLVEEPEDDIAIAGASEDTQPSGSKLPSMQELENDDSTTSLSTSEEEDNSLEKEIEAYRIIRSRKTHFVSDAQEAGPSTSTSTKLVGAKRRKMTVRRKSVSAREVSTLSAELESKCSTLKIASFRSKSPDLEWVDAETLRKLSQPRKDIIRDLLNPEERLKNIKAKALNSIEDSTMETVSLLQAKFREASLLSEEEDVPDVTKCSENDTVGSMEDKTKDDKVVVEEVSTEGKAKPIEEELSSESKTKDDPLVGEELSSEGKIEIDPLVGEEISSNGKMEDDSLSREEITSEGKSKDDPLIEEEEISSEGKMKDDSLSREEISSEGKTENDALGRETVSTENNTKDDTLIGEELNSEGKIKNDTLVGEEISSEGKTKDDILVGEEVISEDKTKDGDNLQDTPKLTQEEPTVPTEEEKCSNEDSKKEKNREDKQTNETNTETNDVDEKVEDDKVAPIIPTEGEEDEAIEEQGIQKMSNIETTENMDEDQLKDKCPEKESDDDLAVKEGAALDTIEKADSVEKEEGIPTDKPEEECVDSEGEHREKRKRSHGEQDEETDMKKKKPEETEKDEDMEMKESEDDNKGKEPGETQGVGEDEMEKSVEEIIRDHVSDIVRSALTIVFDKKKPGEEEKLPVASVNEEKVISEASPQPKEKETEKERPMPPPSKEKTVPTVEVKQEVRFDDSLRATESPMSGRESVPPAYLYPSVSLTVDNDKEVETNPPLPHQEGPIDMNAVRNGSLSIDAVKASVGLPRAISLSIVSSSSKEPEAPLDMECDHESDQEESLPVPATPTTSPPNYALNSLKELTALAHGKRLSDGDSGPLPKARKTFPNRPHPQVKITPASFANTNNTVSFLRQNRRNSYSGLLNGDVTVTAVNGKTSTTEPPVESNGGGEEASPMVAIPNGLGAGGSGGSNVPEPSASAQVPGPSLPIGVGGDISNRTRVSPTSAATAGRMPSHLQLPRPAGQPCLPGPSAAPGPTASSGPQPYLPNAPNPSEGLPLERPRPFCMTPGIKDKLLGQVADFLLAGVEEMLRDLSHLGVLEAQIKCLQIERDKAQWQHQQELNDFKRNSDLIVVELRNSLMQENQRQVEETIRRCELEKQRAIEETKKKQWCVQCSREANYHCCWNTSYCDYSCQQRHWPAHMATCGQTVTNGNLAGDHPSERPPQQMNNIPVSRPLQQANNLPRSAPQQSGNAPSTNLMKMARASQPWLEPNHNPSANTSPMHPSLLDDSSRSLSPLSVLSSDNVEDDLNNNAEKTSEDGVKGRRKGVPKRRRCGTCEGCRSVNCGQCPPCTNTKTHQVCRQRRCLNLQPESVRQSATQKKQVPPHLVVPSVPMQPPSVPVGPVPPPQYAAQTSPPGGAPPPPPPPALQTLPPQQAQQPRTRMPPPPPPPYMMPPMPRPNTMQGLPMLPPPYGMHMDQRAAMALQQQQQSQSQRMYLPPQPPRPHMPFNLRPPHYFM